MPFGFPAVAIAATPIPAFASLCNKEAQQRSTALHVHDSCSPHKASRRFFIAQCDDFSVCGPVKLHLVLLLPSYSTCPCCGYPASVTAAKGEKEQRPLFRTCLL